MSNVKTKIETGINLIPVASPTLTEQGDISYDSDTNKLKVRGSSTTDSVVEEAKAATLTNKKLSDSTTEIVDASDDTKKIKFDAAGTTGTTTTIASSQTSNRTITLPDSSDTLATLTDVNNHIGDTSGAHAASAISSTPSGNLAATDVQAALNELQSDVDTRATSSDLSNHTGTTTGVHGSTSVNTASRIVERDANKNINVSKITVDSGSNQGLDVASAGALDIGKSVGANNITVGGATSTVIIPGNLTVQGTATALDTTNTNIKDALVTLNKGGAAGSAGGSGIEFEEDGSITGYVKVSSDRTKIEVKAPNGGGGIASIPMGTAPFADDVVTLNTLAQTLSNKTFSDAITLAEVSEPTTPASGFGKIYFGTDGSLYQKNDDGSASKVGSGTGGGIEYILNPNAESNTTGYVTYADAAGTTPVDGDGGSADITWTRSTSNPLRGVANFLLTKDGVNRQGQGVAYAFTIDRADLAKVLTISFDYEIGSGTYANNDIGVYIYDVTNGSLIQPAPYNLLNIVGQGTFKATFQTSSNSTSYRLLFHVASTSASAYSIKFDSISVKPQQIQYGSPVTDWVDDSANWSASGSFGTLGLKQVFKRRVGDSYEIRGQIKVGTVTAATAYLEFTGFSIDNTKVVNISVSNAAVGIFTATSSSNVGLASTNSFNPIIVDGLTSNRVFFCTATASSILTKANANGIVASSEYISFDFKVPVSGFSSSVQMSSDADTRVVAARYSSSTAQTIDANQVVGYENKQFDTHNAVSGSGTSWKFTAPVSGIYRVSIAAITASIAWGAANRNLATSLFKNGVLYSTIAEGYTSGSYTGYISNAGSTLIDLNAGDYIQIKQNANQAGVTTLGSYPNCNWVAIERISGPSQIAASETVAASYKVSTNTQAITNSQTIVNFDTSIYDTHGAVTTGASWKFTAPVAGFYTIKTAFQTSAFISSGVNNATLMTLYKNGTAFRVVAIVYSMSTSTCRKAGLGGCDIYLNAGDYIDIRSLNTGNEASVTMDGTGTSTVYIDISKINK